MEIRLTAMLLERGETVEMDEWMAALKIYAQNSQESVSQFLRGKKPDGYNPEREPLLALTDFNEKYYAGLVVRVKNLDRLLELSMKTGKLVMDAKDLEEETKSVETNFFLLSKDGGHVLYQHYHGATHPNRFCSLLAKCYTNVAAWKRQEIKSDEEKGEISKKVATEKRKGLKKLSYSILSDSRSVPSMIDGLSDLSKVKFVRNVVEFEGDEMRVLSDEAKSESIEIRFTSSLSLQNVKGALKRMFKKGQFKRLRIEGMEPGKIEKVIDLFNNYEYIDRKNFNDVSEDLKVDFEDLESSINDSLLTQWLDRVSRSKTLHSRINAAKV